MPLGNGVMRRIDVSKRLLAAAGGALLILCAPLALIASDRYAQVARSNTVAPTVGLARSASDLVHELQKERGISIAYVAGQRRIDLGLAEQRHASDRAVARYLAHVAAAGRDIATDLSARRTLAAWGEIDALPRHRAAVDRLQAGAADVLAAYSRLVDTLAASVADLVNEIDGTSLVRRLQAYRALMIVKESAGLERATGNALAAGGGFDPEHYRAYVAAVTRQADYLAEFAAVATDEQKAIVAAATGAAATAPVAAMRHVLLDLTRTPAGAGPATSDWWRATTARIEGLKDAEDRLAEGLAGFAVAQAQTSRDVFWGVMAAEAGALALLALLALAHVRHTGTLIREGEDRLAHLALHDSLSGLANRTLFGEQLTAAIEGLQHDGPAAALVYVDLDFFKEVNDTLGHPVGDELIRVVARRLRDIVGDGELAARLGADEFALILTGVGEPERLGQIGGRILAAVGQPIEVGGHSLTIGASAGIAVIDDPQAVAIDVMRCADAALERAKAEGRNRVCIYDLAMAAALRRRTALQHDLWAAIDGEQLSLVYQPTVRAADETILGVEALCRWRHPEHGDIPPSEFIPIAEQSGQIIALGDWVLRRACRDARAWPDLTLAVNVAALQFRRTAFVDVVERILSATGFDPARLELEVTESMLIGNPDTVLRTMKALQAHGVRFALDDFGTGYSSLAYLRRFPFDRIKIDRGFVSSIDDTVEVATIVHAIVGMGRGLGMKVTAEGVETVEQQIFLRAAGVHAMQGYRFGAPVAAAVIATRLGLGAAPAARPAALAG